MARTSSRVRLWQPESVEENLALTLRANIKMLERLFSTKVLSTMRMMGHPVQSDHSACGEPPVNFKTKVPLWPGQGRTGQAKAELLD